MAILTTSGRIALATAIKGSTLHLAWGSGEAEWDTTQPREPRSAIALTNEIGRRKVNLVEYCTPQGDGDIVMLGARFAKSDTPGDIASPGTLLAIDYITAMQRGVGARISFDFVITF